MASVYVRGFLKRTGERDLETLFSTFGAVNEVRMVRDFAFVVTSISFRFSNRGTRLSKQSVKWTDNRSKDRLWLSKSQKKDQDLNLMTSAGHAETRDIGTFDSNLGKQTVPTTEEGKALLIQAKKKPTPSIFL